MFTHVIWPHLYDQRRAHLHALNEAETKTPPELVWEVPIDAGNWPSCYPHAERREDRNRRASVSIGFEIHLKGSGLPLANTAKEFVSGERIAWDSVPAEAEGPTAYQRLGRHADGQRLSSAYRGEAARCLVAGARPRVPRRAVPVPQGPGGDPLAGGRDGSRAGEGLTSEVCCRESSFSAPVASLRARAGTYQAMPADRSLRPAAQRR
jgi:hypothetical protein